MTSGHPPSTPSADSPSPDTDASCDAVAPHLSVVIPAYDEEARLGATLTTLLTYLGRQSYTWEVVIVDDGSRDGTSRVAAEAGRGLPVRVLRHEPNRGKGFSIRRGMLEARGTHRLFTDADLSTPIAEIETFWPLVEAGNDVIFASRDMLGSRLARPQPPLREAMGRVFNLAVRVLVLRGVHDTQCGFKLFTARAAETVFPRQKLDGFAFDVEVLALARRLGFTIKEAPVEWIDAPGSKVSMMRGARAFLDLLSLRLRKL